MVCHGDGASAWSCAVMSASAPAIDAFVAVGASAIDPIPDAPADITIIPNAVDLRDSCRPSTATRNESSGTYHPRDASWECWDDSVPKNIPALWPVRLRASRRTGSACTAGMGRICRRLHHGFPAAGTRIYWPGATRIPARRSVRWTCSCTPAIARDSVWRSVKAGWPECPSSRPLLVWLWTIPTWWSQSRFEPRGRSWRRPCFGPSNPPGVSWRIRGPYGLQPQPVRGPLVGLSRGGRSCRSS